MSETPQETPEAPETPVQEPVEAPGPDAGGDDTPDEQEEGDEADEPRSHGATPEQWEERFKKSEQRFATYERALFGIFEDDAHDLLACPLCLGPTRGFLDKNIVGHIPEEQAQTVKFILGITQEIEYPHGSQYRACPECEGLGKVTTGSRVPGQEKVGCGACNELGWIGPETVPGNGHKKDAGVVTGPTVYADSGALDDVDEWKEPRILPDGRQNPNFGKMPNRKVPVEPWGVTAGLTAQDRVEV